MGKTRKAKRLTGNPIRELPFLAWRNNSAWIETMRGRRWKNVLSRERRYFNTLLTPHIRKTALAYSKELMAASLMCGIDSFTIADGTIVIRMSGNGFYWRWIWSKHYHLASDLDFYDNKAYYILFDKEGNLIYLLLMIVLNVLLLIALLVELFHYLLICYYFY